jgi:hypothetical protein
MGAYTLPTSPRLLAGHAPAEYLILFVPEEQSRAYEISARILWSPGTVRRPDVCSIRQADLACPAACWRAGMSLPSLRKSKAIMVVCKVILPGFYGIFATAGKKP